MYKNPRVTRKKDIREFKIQKISLSYLIQLNTEYEAAGQKKRKIKKSIRIITSIKRNANQLNAKESNISHNTPSIKCDKQISSVFTG